MGNLFFKLTYTMHTGKSTNHLMTLGTQNTLMSPAPRSRHRTLSATQKGWGEERLLKDSYFLNPLNVLDLRLSPGICIFKTHPGDFLHTIRPGDQESTKGFQICPQVSIWDGGEGRSGDGDLSDLPSPSFRAFCIFSIYWLPSMDKNSIHNSENQSGFNRRSRTTRIDMTIYAFVDRICTVDRIYIYISVTGIRIFTIVV